MIPIRVMQAPPSLLSLCVQFVCYNVSLFQQKLLLNQKKYYLTEDVKLLVFTLLRDKGIINDSNVESFLPTSQTILSLSVNFNDAKLHKSKFERNVHKLQIYRCCTRV